MTRAGPAVAVLALSRRERAVAWRACQHRDELVGAPPPVDLDRAVVDESSRCRVGRSGV